MSIPITKKVRTRSIHEDTMDISMNADGSGGPFRSPVKKKPCWENYKMVGTKKKRGKTVPNCVPK
jgi:hypothetical protein